MNLSIEENVSLAEYTTLKIGGEARFFLSAHSEKDVIEAVWFADRNNLNLFILGGGSNVLIADDGFDGLVLRVALKGVSTKSKENGIVEVRANAGEDWEQFVAFCVGENLQGVECLSGIPGFVGGTPVQNVGAYGQKVSEAIATVRCLDRRTGKTIALSNAECGFAYRASIFNTTEKNRYVVLAVSYNLVFNGEPKIVYRDLRNYFGDAKPNLEETRRAVLKIRTTKSMVINAEDPNSRSAGSFFKNPIVAEEKFSAIEKRAAKCGIKNVPSFEVGEKTLKIPAAWLIENSGFYKGFEFGRVGLSTKHALALVNRGGGTAADILAFKDEIQTRVKEKFGIELMPEPVFVGF
jgi:UDP-N-acetylmuramate dehydrogenase